MENSQKSIQLNPIHSALIQDINPNESESFRPWINSVQINLSLDWFGLAQIKNVVWIHLDCSGINRIKSELYLIDFHNTEYKNFFGMGRKKI